MAQLHFDITADNEKLLSALNQTMRAMQNVSTQAEKTGQDIDNTFNIIGDAADSLKGKLAGALSLAGAAAFVKKVYETRSYFQDIESSMEVFLGSQEKAQKFTADLKDYAWYNMFEFSDLADASKQLIAYGNEVDKISGKGGILDQLSNIATATKQPLMDLVNAWNKAKNIGKVDAMGMQSWAAKGLVLRDVLAEMGEEVKGNTVSFEQLQKAIAHVTEEGEMFGGIMDKMMPNLSSSWGQLQDDLDSMFNEIGEKLQGPIKKGIEFASMLVDNYKTLGKVIEGLIITYGGYRAALVVTSSVEKLAALSAKGYSAAEMLLLGRLKATEAAQKLLNKTMLNNPYVLVTAAVIGLGVALYKASQNTLLVEASSKSINKALVRAGDAAQEELDSLDELYATLKDATEGTQEYTDAKDKLIDQFGKYDKNLLDENGHIKDLDASYRRLTESIRESYKEREYREQKNAIREEFTEKAGAQKEKILSKLKNELGNVEGYRAYQQLIDVFESGKYELTGTNAQTGITANKTIQNILNKYYGKDVTSATGTIYGDGKVSLTGRIIELAKLYEGVNKGLEDLAEGFWADEKEFQQARDDLRSAIQEAANGKSADEKKQFLGDLKKEVEDTAKMLEEHPDMPVTLDLSKFIDFQFPNGLLTPKNIQHIVDDIKEEGQGIGGNTSVDPEQSKKDQAAWKANQMRKNNERQQKRQIEDQQHAISEASIKAMEEGSAKELAAMRLAHDKEMRQLKRQEEDKLKQLNDNARAEWVAGAPDRKEYQFGTKYSELPKEYKDLYEKQAQQLNEAYSKQLDEFFASFGSKEELRRQMLEKQVSALEDLQKRLDELNAKAEKSIADNKEAEALTKAIDKAKKANAVALAKFDYDAVADYGAIDEQIQKLRILRKAEAETLEDEAQREVAIAKAEVEIAELVYRHQGNYLYADQEAEAIEAIYNAKIKEAQARKDNTQAMILEAQKMRELDDLALKNSLDYSLIFGNFGSYSKNELARAIDATQKAIKKAKTSGDIEALSELYGELREQMTEQFSRNSKFGFGGIKQGLKAYADAQTARNKARQERSWAKSYGESLANAKDSDYATDEDLDHLRKLEKEAKANYESYSEDARKAEENAINAISAGLHDIENTFKWLGDALSSFGDETDGWRHSLTEIANSFSGIASAVANSTSFLAEFIDKGKEMSKATATTALISGSLQLLSMIGNSIARNIEAQKEWTRAVQQTDHELVMLNLEAKEYSQSNIFGIEDPFKKATDSADLYISAMSEIEKMTDKLASGQVKTDNKKALDWKNIAEGAAIGATIGLAGSVLAPITATAGAILGGAIGLITGIASTKTVAVYESLEKRFGYLYDDKTYELNPEIIAAYETLDDETKQIVDNWKDIKEKAKQAKDDLMDNLSDFAGDLGTQLRDALVDAWKNHRLYQAIDDYKDYVNNTISDILQQRAFSAVFGSLFNDLEQRMQNSFIGKNADYDLVDDINEFMPEYEKRIDLFDKAMEQMQQQMESMGYEGFYGNQKNVDASRGSFQTISESTGTALEGRFTAIQISNEVIAQSATQGVILLTTINSFVTSGSETLAEIRNMHEMEVGYLEDISKNTAPLLTFGTRLDDIVRNTSRI